MPSIIEQTAANLLAQAEKHRQSGRIKAMQNCLIAAAELLHGGK